MFFEPLLAALAVCNVLQRHNPLAKARNCKAVSTVLERKRLQVLVCRTCPAASAHHTTGKAVRELLTMCVTRAL